MVDTRFHAFSGPFPLSEILTSLGVAIARDAERVAALTITGASELETAEPGHIALAASKAYLDQLRGTAAGAVIVVEELREHVPQGSIPIVDKSAHLLFANLIDRLYPGDTRATVKALVEENGAPPIVEDGARIGRGVVLGPGVEIGRGTYVGPNSVIGPGVAIGRDCTIGAGCTVECAYLGNNVVLHAGARIGSEGFGWLDFGVANRKIPQLGRVILQDGVEIGANTTVDRGALGDTVVGEGTKVDNLVQIGHNCRIGRSCLIAALACLSGSTVLGDAVMMAPGSFTSGHLTIGAGSVLRVGSVVTKSLPAGSDVFGNPSTGTRDFWRQAATLRRLSRSGEQ